MGKRGERMKEGEGRRIEEESKNGMGKRGRENERRMEWDVKQNGGQWAEWKENVESEHYTFLCILGDNILYLRTAFTGIQYLTFVLMKITLKWAYWLNLVCSMIKKTDEYSTNYTRRLRQLNVVKTSVRQGPINWLLFRLYRTYIYIIHMLIVQYPQKMHQCER